MILFLTKLKGQCGAVNRSNTFFHVRCSSQTVIVKFFTLQKSFPKKKRQSNQFDAVLDYKGRPDRASYIAEYLPDATWSEWINLSSPETGNYDIESIQMARTRFSICA